LQSHVYANFSLFFFVFPALRVSCKVSSRHVLLDTLYVYVTTTRRRHERVARRPGMYERNHLRATRGRGRHGGAQPSSMRTENHLGTLVLPCLLECTALDQFGGSKGRIAEKDGERDGETERGRISLSRVANDENVPTRE